MVVKGATMSTRHASSLAHGFSLSKYTVGFIIIAIISILPETLISINSSLEGVPSFALGMLFGSNIADLTLIFALIVLITGRGIKIDGHIVKNRNIFPFLLLLPLVLGFDGYYSRLEGLALIIAGALFYLLALRKGIDNTEVPNAKEGRIKGFVMLLLSLAILLVGAHYTVESATSIASIIGVSPILIGMLVVGLGTTIPEAAFSLNAVRKNDDSLAVGDILGTVLADATVVVGILSLINPFYFPRQIIFITGIFMVLASIITFNFMKSGRAISRREAWLLVAFWIIFVIVEFASAN